MSRHASGSDFKQPPTGTHIARCIRLVDLGTQHSEYMGEPTSNPQVLVTWELPGEQMEDGKPFTISKFYNIYLSSKATLRKDLEGWRGRSFTAEELKKFDLQNVLGKPCMLNAVENDKQKTIVASVSGLPKGITCPPAINALSAFWLDEWDEQKYSALPEGLQKLIAKSDEFKAMHAPVKSGNGFDDMEDDGPGSQQFEQTRKQEADADIPFRRAA
jgi:hypothetical protein